MCEVLDPEAELAPVLSLCKVNSACYQKIITSALGSGIPTFGRKRNSGLVLALVSGEQIVGLLHYELSWRWNAIREEASLKLDLALPSTRYKRLAKLVLRAALSREARLMVEALHKRRVTHAVTTVFSEHPESMKYRGLFQQTSREELEDGTGRFRLRYRGEFTSKSLAEHYAEWFQDEVQIRAGSIAVDTPEPKGEGGSYPSLRSSTETAPLYCSACGKVKAVPGSTKCRYHGGMFGRIHPGSRESANGQI